MSKKRAFVRYTKAGKIVPGSLILTNGTYPESPSIWKEVSADLCCNNDSCCDKKTISASLFLPVPSSPYYVISVEIFCPNNEFSSVRERSSIYTLRTIVGWNTLQEMFDAFYDYSGIEIKVIPNTVLISITYCASKVPCLGINGSGECLHFRLGTSLNGGVSQNVAGGCENSFSSSLINFY